MIETCKATLKSGARCKRQPSKNLSSGYCMQHDPDAMAADDLREIRRRRRDYIQTRTDYFVARKLRELEPDLYERLAADGAERIRARAEKLFPEE